MPVWVVTPQGCCAVRARSDVEEEVGALAGGLDQELDQLVRTLVIIVVDVVAPAVVDGLASFERDLVGDLGSA